MILLIIVEMCQKQIDLGVVQGSGFQNQNRIEFNINFPCYENIIKSIPKEMSIYKNLSHINSFFLNRKQKPFNFSDKMQGILLVGCNIEIQIEFMENMKMKQYTLQNGNILFFNDKDKKIRFSGFKDDGNRDQVDMRQEFKVLMICFMIA